MRQQPNSNETVTRLACWSALRVLLASIVLGALIGPSPAAETATLTIVYPQEKNAFHDAAAAIIRQAYGRLGIGVVFETFPAERALQMSNRGLADGELVRIEGIDAEFPNLIRVPVSHVTAEQMAFGRDPAVVVDGWSSLRPYKLVFHRGYKVAEANTAGMDRHLAGTDLAAFKMVEAGRRDLALANRFTGAAVIEALGFRDVVMITPPVQVDPLFHYLHMKHADLVPKITAVLREMADNGEMDAIRRRFDVPLLND